jgi:inorganic phosphate transporter, PiT family
VMLLCAAAMALGTAAGGWRIIKTMGVRMIRLAPVHGFAAETAASIVILTASHLGSPVSTTHVISSSIMGVGTAKRATAVRWEIAGQMGVAWVLTIPATALVAYLIGLGFKLFGM